MAANPALPANLVGRALRTLTDTEIQVGTTLLDDAWSIIVTRVPSVATRLDALPPDTGFFNLVVQIECAMVLRVIYNPTGLLEENVDDYATRRDATTSTGALYLTDAEEDLLGMGDGSSAVAFTITPVAQPFFSLPTQWEPEP